jgi:nitrogen regulatory protein P-II 1
MREWQETDMKLISSVVRSEKVDEIKAALNRVNVFGLTVSEVHDYTPQKHETTVWRGHEYSVGFSHKQEIAIVVHDEDVDEVVKVIICTAKTGELGDGHVTVFPIEHRYNIRNGERDIS